MTDPSDDVDSGRPRGLPPREVRTGAEPVAWRLTFRYDEDGVRLSARQRVAMLAPPDDSDRTRSARAGYWVELRDADGHGVYRQILVDPMPVTYEAHSPLPGARPTRVPAPAGDSGIFQAVVPDLPAAEEVVLHGLAEPGAPTTAPEDFRSTAVPLLVERLRDDPAAGS